MQVFTEQELFKIVEKHGGQTEEYFLNLKGYKKDGYLRKGTGSQKTFERQLNEIFTSVKMLRRSKGVTKYEVGEYKNEIKVVADGRINSGRGRHELDYQMADIFYPLLCNAIGKNEAGTVESKTITEWVKALKYPKPLSTYKPTAWGKEGEDSPADKMKNRIMSYGTVTQRQATSIVNMYNDEMNNKAKGNLTMMLKILQERGLIEYRKYDVLYTNHQVLATPDQYTEDDVTAVKDARMLAIDKSRIQKKQFYMPTNDFERKTKDEIHKQILEYTGFYDTRLFYEIKLLVDLDNSYFDKSKFLDLYYKKIDVLIENHHENLANVAKESKTVKEFDKHCTFIKKFYKYHFYYVLVHHQQQTNEHSKIIAREAIELYRNLSDALRTHSPKREQKYLMNKAIAAELQRDREQFPTAYKVGFGEKVKYTDKAFDLFYFEYNYQHYKDNRTSTNKLVEEKLTEWEQSINDQLPF